MRDVSRTLAALSKNMPVHPAPLSGTPLGVGARAMGPRPGMTLSAGRFHHFSVSDEQTTLTEENAIAAPASMGCMYKPKGRKKPIASGMPRTLYMHAQTRYQRMTEKNLRERCRAATTSRRSDRIRTMSAASIATDVPEESAMPTVAATRAGESLMPSPT